VYTAFGVYFHSTTGICVFFNRFILTVLIMSASLVSLTCGRHDANDLRRAEALFSEGASKEKEFRYLEAAERYTQAANLFETNNEPARASDVYVSLGSMEHTAGNFYQAIDRYTHAAILAQNAGDHARQSSILLMIARIHSTLGQTERAISLTKQSLAISEMFGEKQSAIAGYTVLGRLYRSNGFFRESIENFSKVRTTARTIGHAGADLDAALSLCEVAIDQKQFIDALQSLALIQHQAVNTETQATHRWYLNQGKAYFGINDYSRAANAFSRAIAYNDFAEPPIQIHTLLRASEVNFLLHRPGEALQQCTDALEIARQTNDRIAEAFLLIHMGDIEQRITSGQAFESYKRAAELFTALDYPSGTARALQHLGRATEESGNLTGAVEIYANALAEYETALTKSFELIPPQELTWTHEESPATVGKNLTRVLLTLNRPEEAFVYYEKCLLDQFAATLRLLGPIPRTESLKPQFDRYRVLSDELITFQRERSIETAKSDERRDEEKLTRLTGVIEEKSAERETIVRTIEKEEPNSSFIFREHTVRIEEIQAQIPPGTVVLEYIPADIQLYCAVLTRSSFSLVRLPSSYPSILQHADELRRVIFLPVSPRERSDAGNIDEQYLRTNTYAQILYGDLLGPVQKYTGSQSGLVIVPPPELSDIPFHALIRSGNVVKGEYVAERQLVRYLPFASAALFQWNPKRLLNSMVAVGNPNVTNWEVDYVLRDIKTFFKEAKLYLGPDATEENLFGSTGDVLHIATDFLYNAAYPHNSFLSLSDGKTANGSVHVPAGSLHELYNYPCVVVMNVGPSIESVNQVHMALLLMNGSRSAIGTFWQPERGAVRAFDEQFYNSLANRMSLESAYLQAQREMIAMPIFRPPHQWAAFFYYGIHQ
jgi:tetratricopeptide (TPR) repeat protein